MSILKQVHERSKQTDIWVDGFAKEDHVYALEKGCLGITTSPTWVGHMVEAEWDTLKNQVQELADANPSCDEREILWKLTLQEAKKRSAILLPIFKEKGPKYGRFAVQLDVYAYRDAEKMLKMALEVHHLAANMQVKIPTTKAGIKVLEEATYQGVSVMATLGFSVSQAIAAAEAIERGLARRKQEGIDTSLMNPVCAVLLGMQEEWLKTYSEQEKIVVDPNALLWAGTAITKKVETIFKEKGYTSRIIVAYYRHQYHFTAFLQDDIIMTIPKKWLVRFDEMPEDIFTTTQQSVPKEAIEELRKLTSFVKAYKEDGLLEKEFDSFPPVSLTLRYFTETYEKAIHKVRDVLLPDYAKKKC